MEYHKNRTNELPYRYGKQMIMRVAYGETDKGAVRICPGDILWPKVPGPIIPGTGESKKPMAM